MSPSGSTRNSRGGSGAAQVSLTTERRAFLYAPRDSLFFIFGIVSTSAAFIALPASQVDTKVFWSSISLACCLAALFFLQFSKYRFFGLYECKLSSWFLAYAVLAFGIATLTILQPQTGSSLAVDKSSVPRALFLVGLSFVAWTAGNMLGAAKIVRNPFALGIAMITRGLSVNVRGRGALIAVFLAGLMGDFLRIDVGGQFGYLGNNILVTVGSASWYTQPFIILSGLKAAALFGLSYRVFVMRLDQMWYLLVPITSLALALGLLTGMKESFVGTAIAVGIPFLLGNSRRRVLPIVAAVLAFTLVVTPIVTGLRVAVRGGSGALDVKTALSVGIKKITSGSETFSAGSEPSGGVSTLTRVRLVDNLALIYTKTPSQLPYRSVDELLAAPVTGLVPRALWPSKPVNISGLDFYRQYYGGTALSSSAITLEGSLFLYGGTLALLFGMLIVGALMRGLDEAMRVWESPQGAFLFVVVGIIVVKQELDVAGFLASIAPLAISWALGSILIFARVPGE